MTLSSRAAIALCALAVALVCSHAGTARGQPDADPRSAALGRLFPKQAVVRAPAGAGLVHLPLGAEVLRAVGPKLEDLRLFDAGGRELPYLLDSALRPAAGELPTRVSLPAKPLEVKQKKGRDRGEEQYDELIEVASPTVASPSGSWELVLDAAAPHFVRMVRVEASDGRELRAGSAFRLPDPLRERLRFELPRDLPPRLRVSLRGADGYLEPTLHFEAARVPEDDRITLSLTEIERHGHEGKTLVTLERPRGIVPERLRVITTSRTFHRPILVRDEGAAGKGRELGADAVYRLSDPEPVERLDVLLAPAQGDRLLVEIADGDSPPLGRLAFQAVVDRPALVFDASAPGPHLLRFGGGRATLPRYDLERLARIGGGRRAVEAAELEVATLGPIEDNPAFDPSPALGFMARPGPAVDPRSFRQRRDLWVSDAGEGVVRYRLGPADLARARPDLADLRVVDATWRQWPYLVEQPVALEVAVSLGVVAGEPGRSRYRIELPARPLTLRGIDFAVEDRYFDRRVTLRASLEGAEVGSWSAALGRRPGQQGPLRVEIPATRLDELVLVVEDGGDPPLSFGQVRISLVSADLYIAAAAGSYALLLGDPRAQPARYELAAARDLVLAVPSREVQADALRDNDEYVPPRDEVGGAERIMWVVILIAVVILGILTVRLVRREEGEPKPEPTPAEPPPAESDSTSGSDSKPEAQRGTPRR